MQWIMVIVINVIIKKLGSRRKIADFYQQLFIFDHIISAVGICTSVN